MKNSKGQKAGILQAWQKHRFMVLINDDIDLAQQVITCSLNCHKKEFEILLRQSITADIMEKINNICTGVGYSKIRVHAQDGQCNNNYFYYEMLRAKIIDHEFKLDYASGDIATHTLTFKYGSLQVK